MSYQKFSFFHIYIYIGLIILFNYAKQGMPFLPFNLILGFPEVEPTLLLIKKKEKKKKKKRLDTFLGLGGGI